MYSGSMEKLQHIYNTVAFDWIFLQLLQSLLNASAIFKTSIRQSHSGMYTINKTTKTAKGFESRILIYINYWSLYSAKSKGKA